MTWHEKHKGQLFCDESSECGHQRAEERMRRGPRRVAHAARRSSTVRHDGERVSRWTRTPARSRAPRWSIATGGLSIPKIGATDFAYRIAKQFGHKLIDTRPALVPLTFAAADWEPFAALSGVSRGSATGDGQQEDGAASSTKTCCSRIAACRARACCRFRATGNPAEPIHINLLPERRRHRRVAGGEDRHEAPDRQPALANGCRRGSRMSGWKRSAFPPTPALADLPDKTLRRRR